MAPHVGLRLPRELVPLYRRYDAVALASQAAASAEDVLRIHARFAALVLPQLEARVELDEARRDSEGAEIELHAKVRGHPRGLGLAVDEYVLSLVLGRCRKGDAALMPTRAWLTSPRPRDLGPLFEALGTREIELGAETTGLAFDARLARAALPGAEPTLVATAEHLATTALDASPSPGGRSYRAAAADAVAAKLESLLGSPRAGDLSANAVAAGLHLSARTLHRRLEAEGTRFGEVLDRVRERRARRLLEDPALPLAEIAYRSGFADLATFSRAFKRWTGIAPGAFRRSKTPS